MKVQELQTFDKYKQYFKYAEEFQTLYPKISYQIQYFVCKNLYSNKNNLSQNQMEYTNKKIQEMKILFEYSKRNNYSLEITKEEFSNFLENLFYNIDEEDRFKTITKKTIGGFKLILDLISVLENFGELNNKWIELRKYCKYKIIDLNKSIRKGEIPKRGGPEVKIENDNTTEKEIENELNLLEEQNNKEEIAERINKEKLEIENLENKKNTNILRKKSDLIVPSNDESSNQINSSSTLNLRIPNQSSLGKLSLAQQFQGNQNLNQINLNRSLQPSSLKVNPNETREFTTNKINPNTIQSDQNSLRNTQIYNQNQFIYSNPNNYQRFILHPQSNYYQYYIPNQVHHNAPLNMNRNYNPNTIANNSSLINHRINAQQINNFNSPSQSNIQQNYEINKNTTNINLTNTYNVRSPPFVKENSTTPKVTREIADPGKPTTISSKSNNQEKKDLFSIEKETNFSFPMERTNNDYNLYKDIIKEHIKYGIYELDFQKIKESTDHVEKALFYLKNIQNN